MADWMPTIDEIAKLEKSGKISTATAAKWMDSIKPRPTSLADLVGAGPGPAMSPSMASGGPSTIAPVMMPARGESIPPIVGEARPARPDVMESAPVMGGARPPPTPVTYASLLAGGGTPGGPTLRSPADLVGGGTGPRMIGEDAFAPPGTMSPGAAAAFRAATGVSVPGSIAAPNEIAPVMMPARPAGAPVPATGPVTASGPTGPARPIDYVGAVRTPEAQKLFKDQLNIADRENMSAADMADASAEGANAVRNLTRNANEDDETIQEEMERKNTERTAYAAAERDKLKEMTEKLAATKVDPGRYWSQADGGSKALAVLGLALGAVGGGATGGVNFASKQLDTLIDRDIEAQKADLATRKDALSARQSLYGQTLKQFGDERIADAATRAMYWDGIGRKLDAITANTTSEKTKIEAAKLKDMVSLKHDAAVDGFTNDARNAYDQRQAAAAAAAAAQRDRLMKLNDEIMKERGIKMGGTLKVAPNGFAYLQMPDGTIVNGGTIGAEKGAEAGGLDVPMISGFNAAGDPTYAIGKASSKEEAAKMREKSAAYRDMLGGLYRMKALREKHSGGALTGADVAEGKALAASALIGMNKLEGLSRFTELEKELYSKMIPEDPLEIKAAGAVGMDPVGNKIDAAIKLVQAKLAAENETGIKGAAPTDTPDLRKPVK